MNTQNKVTTLDNISKTVTPIQYQMIPPFAEILMNELKNPDSQIHGVLLNGFQKIADRACAEMIEMQEEFYEKHREELNQLLKDVRTNIIKDFSQTIVKLKENLENQKINFQNLRQELCSCILEYKKSNETIFENHKRYGNFPLRKEATKDSKTTCGAPTGISATAQLDGANPTCARYSTWLWL